MKQLTKYCAAALAVVCGLAATGPAQAQGITGTQYLSNISSNACSYSGNWAANGGTVTSTLTGLEITALGGSGSFSTLYYAIPGNQQAAANTAATSVIFDFTWNAPAGATTAGVNILFALDDSMGGTVYYGTGYNVLTGGTSYSQTFALTGANAANIAAGAVVNGMNLQIDPANVGAQMYDITFNSLTLSPSPTPEPAAMALSGLGFAGLLIFRRRS
jgi:hypothetical protein